MKKYLSIVLSSLMFSSCTTPNLYNSSMEDAAPTVVENFDQVQVDDVKEPEEEILVDNGSAEYFYKLGVKYEEGKGVDVDLAKAEQFYQKAIDRGSVDAMNALGVIFLGKGDYDKAKNFFEKSALEGDEIAYFNLGNLSFIGFKGKENKQALNFYQKSADKKYSPAFVALGDMYAMGKGVTHDVKKAEENYLKAADLNDDLAIDRLSLLYLLQDGMEVESDDTENSIKTVQLFQRVAEKGNAKAMYVLSLLYQNGFYVKEDNNKSIEYLKKSAALGYPEAEYSLAYLYLTGMYVEKDYKKGVQLMTNAANKNLPDAQNNIGMLYLKGELVPKDLKRAKKWLEQASANGSAMGDYNLGVIYEAGMGESIDNQKAGQLYLKSADNGYLPAFAKVVDMYATGTKGVLKDNVKAREWLDQAIDKDDSDAMLLKANAYFYGNYGYAKDMALAKEWLDKAKQMDNPKASTVESNWKRSERFVKLQGSFKK